MSLREKMNDNPVVVGGIVAGLVVLTLVLFLWPSGSGSAATESKGFYFTEDNGKTFFVAPPASIPGDAKGPSGKPAYIARVVQYDKGPREIAWVESYTPKGIAALKEFYSDPANKNKPADMVNLDPEKLVRRPGVDRWSPYGSSEYSNITFVPDKNGVTASHVGPE